MWMTEDWDFQSTAWYIQIIIFSSYFLRNGKSVTLNLILMYIIQIFKSIFSSLTEYPEDHIHHLLQQLFSSNLHIPSDGTSP